MQMYLKRGISNSAHLIGFTLAEVLITLGIIGVVSAMTIPTLISNYNDKVIETRKVKAKSVLSNAFNELRVEAGGGNLSLADIAQCEDEDCFEGQLRKVFKIASKLDMTSDKAKEPYTFANGKKEVWSDDKHFVFLLSDGTIYGIEKSDSIKNGSFSIVLDLNGHKTPNIGSDDLCRYIVNNNAGVIESCESMKNFTVKTCEIGYYMDGSECKALPQGCVTGSLGYIAGDDYNQPPQNVRCDSCLDGYYLNGPFCTANNEPSPWDGQ